MKLIMHTRDYRWWFWPVTLVFIIAALFGWLPGFYIVMAVSFVQVIVFLIKI